VPSKPSAIKSKDRQIDRSSTTELRDANLKNEIWRLMGHKSRPANYSDSEAEDFSDDDMMEAGLEEMEAEERRAERLARKEEQEEEKREAEHRKEKLKRLKT